MSKLLNDTLNLKFPKKKAGRNPQKTLWEIFAGDAEQTVVPILPWVDLNLPDKKGVGRVQGYRSLEDPYKIQVELLSTHEVIEVDLREGFPMLSRAIGYSPTRLATGREWLENLLRRDTTGEIVHISEYLRLVKEYLAIIDGVPLSSPERARLDEVYEHGDVLDYFLCYVDIIDAYQAYEPELFAEVLKNPPQPSPELLKLFERPEDSQTSS